MATASDLPARHIVFIYFGPFYVNSAIQAFHFGNDLTDIGWRVTLAGAGDPAAIERVGQPRFECVSHHELPLVLERARRMPEPTTVVAWTPRENVRKLTADFVRRLGVPYFVHLEDNEEYLFESSSGWGIDEFHRLPSAEQDRLAIPTLIHPGRYREFLSGAAG